MKVFGFSFGRPPRRAWLAGLVVVFAGVCWLWYSGFFEPPGNARSRRRGGGFAVETRAVEKITLRDVRRFTGNLIPAAAFVVAPKISGRVEQLAVNLGDLVKNGQVVARLDDDEQIQQVNQARAELGVAGAALEEARSLWAVMERRLTRSKDLFAKGIGTETELENAQVEAGSQQARVKVTEAQVVQKRAALRTAEVKLSHTVIRVAWNGEGGRRVVGERFVSEGDMVAANNAMLSVLDIEFLTAVVFATEADYALLRPGLEVAVNTDVFPEQNFPGRIERVAPQFQQASRQARLEVTVPNPDNLLKPGMFVRVEVEVARWEQAVVVPAESVVSRAGQKGVFMVDANEAVAQFVPVRTGLPQGDRIQVLEPVLEGKVVSLGQHLLADGASVRVVHGSNGKGPASPPGPAGRPPNPPGKGAK